MTTAPTLVPVPERRPTARTHAGAHLDTPTTRRGAGTAVVGAHALELPWTTSAASPPRPSSAGAQRCSPSRHASQVLVEVLAGSRPAPQVVRYVAPMSTPRSPGGPWSPHAEGAPPTRVAIRRVRVFEVSADVAEVSTVIHGRDRVTAMAMRLEDQDGRWVVTALSVG